MTQGQMLCLGLFFLVREYSSLPNHTKWGGTEEDCRISGKLFPLYNKIKFLRNFCLVVQRVSNRYLFLPGQTWASLRGCEVCQPRPSEGQTLWFLCFQLFCFFMYFHKGFHLNISRLPSLMRSRPTSKQRSRLPTQLISSILKIESSSQVFLK